jgi:helix-turn-helix protein
VSWKATAFVKPMTHYRDGTKMRAAEKLLLFVLADDHNEGRGYAWPSQKTLAKNSLMSDRQVRRLLAKILSKNWPLRVELQPKSGKFEMGSSHYYFVFDEDKLSSPIDGRADKLSGVRTQSRPVGADTAMSREVAFNRQLEPSINRNTYFDHPRHGEGRRKRWSAEHGGTPFSYERAGVR